ncbi:FecR family protein [Chitinophaga sp. 30R24]|uniref:FecR family protein n=1 Tax=Chitinophaga sp. 30R24 TaxID=3248838 RepID=UPI003B91B318
MNRQDFFSLIDKWMNGWADEGELRQLMNYYYSFKADDIWDESHLGVKALLEAEIEQRLLLNVRRMPQENLAPAKYIWWPRIAVAVAVLLLLAAGWWLQKPTAPVKMGVGQRFATKAGEHQQIRLPDSTLVWLSPASSLQYSAAFGAGSREVVLQGEAFFEVAAAASHPFIIHSGRVNTQVLGTSFNIQAFDAQPDVAITVITGKVSVAAGASTAAVLVAPQQRAIFSKSSGVIIRENAVSTDRILSRREGILKYDRTSLPEVAAQLGYYYNVKITITGDTPGCFYFGEFNTHLPLEKALQQLCLTLNATLEKQGGSYIIKKAKC